MSRTLARLFTIWEHSIDRSEANTIACYQIGNMATIMRLLGREKLPPLQQESEQTRKWLSVWVSEVSHARWKVPSELLEQYPSAFATAEDTFLFSVCESGTLLELRVAFAQGIAIITAIVKKL